MTYPLDSNDWDTKPPKLLQPYPRNLPVADHNVGLQGRAAYNV